jgi:hypothetical protein
MFHQLDVSSSWCFINLVFYQLDVASTWCFINLMFHQLDVSTSVCQFDIFSINTKLFSMIDEELSTLKDGSWFD